MKTTKDNYRIYIYIYGIVAVLMLNEYFEQQEKFEECAKIMDAVKDHEEKTGQKLGTFIDDELITKIKEGYKEFGLTGKWVTETAVYYMEVMLDELQMW